MGFDNKAKCWIVTEGLAGTENQCLGVAEALGVIPKIKRVALRWPWRLFSPFLRLEQSWSFIPPLKGPWPDLLIASGRKSIAAARYIKRASGGRTFTVQIQDPRIASKNFDLVAVPNHDSLRGKNVIVTDAAPNRITPEKLEAARAQFVQLENLPAPRVAVLIGGNSKDYTLSESRAAALAKDLLKLNAGLMITTSRRTGKENEEALRRVLNGKHIFFWDGQGENPYLAMLAWADFILVTEDSASMISDAASTGKPVYRLQLDGKSRRLSKLHCHLENKGILRVFDGKLEKYSYTRLNDAGKIAAAIKTRLKSVS